MKLVKSFNCNIRIYGSETLTLRKLERSSFGEEVLERAVKNTVEERVTSYKVLRRLDERRILSKTIAKSRSSMIGHLIRHSNWFTTMIKGISAFRTLSLRILSNLVQPLTLLRKGISAA